MLRWFLLHGVLLVAFMVLVIALKLNRAKSLTRYIRTAINIPLELLGMFLSLMVSSAIAAAVIDGKPDIGSWIMAVGNILALIAPLLAVVLMARSLDCGKAPKFVFVVAGIAILASITLQLKSFDLAYSIMEQWDVMSKEEYDSATRALNLVDMSQLFLSILPAGVFVVYTIVNGLKNKK